MYKTKDDLTLYRKNANGNVAFWRCFPSTGYGEQMITIEHGVIDGVTKKESISTHRTVKAEINSRYNAKLKQGYKRLSDIKDNNPNPVKGTLKDYLITYLPEDRTTSDGSLLPMLAKVFDNTNNKLFKNDNIYLGQWKINGLRCFIRAVEDNNGLFNSTRFTFQSREGTYWNSLNHLSDYLLTCIPHDFITRMITENIILDGELYIPGFTINDLNHHIKNVNSPYNKFVQFWCYDLYIDNTIQIQRHEELIRNFYQFQLKNIDTLEDHMNIKTLFNVLPSVGISNESEAIGYRNQFINLGFEGLIMRNLGIEYATGSRKMIKFKKATDGIFTIVDIKSEGIKRNDIPLFVCRNDVNSACFEVHIGGSFDLQRKCLINKDKLIGKKLFIEYGERSGVESVPFHVKLVRFADVNTYRILN